MESVAFIQWCLDHLNYWTITLLMAIESSFIPFPSEVVVPPAAWKAANNDNMNIYLVVLFATIGANIGALINYYLAKWLGRPIITSLPTAVSAQCASSTKPKCSMRKNILTSMEPYQPCRPLIPAVRQLISIPAGLARMKLGTFLLYTTLGAGLWNSILAFIGYYLSTVPGIENEEQLLAKVTEYSHEIGYVFIGIGVLIVAFFIYKGMKKK